MQDPGTTKWEGSCMRCTSGDFSVTYQIAVLQILVFCMPSIDSFRKRIQKTNSFNIHTNHLKPVVVKMKLRKGKFLAYPSSHATVPRGLTRACLTHFQAHPASCIGRTLFLSLKFTIFAEATDFIWVPIVNQEVISASHNCWPLHVTRRSDPLFA